MDFLIAVWYYLITMSLVDLTFLHCGHMPRCDARVDKHFDGYHTLQFAETGGVELFYGERRHLLARGTGYFWPACPGPNIRFHAAPGGAGYWLHRYAAFRGPRVARWIADGLWPDGPQPAPLSEARNYPARFDDLLRLARLSGTWEVARAINLLEAFLIELAEDRTRAGAPEAVPEPWLADLLRQTEEHSGRATDYEKLAHDHGMALSTLRRRFQAEVGVPLHEWTIQRRILRARDLLGETDLPVKAIAEQLGYSDVYFFTRQFRQLAGVPPASWRKTRQR